MRSLFAIAFLALTACGGGGGGGGGGPVGGGNPSFLGPSGGGLGADACGGYPEETTSPYVLPYEVGSTFQVIHGNCTAQGTSHQTSGTRQYAYDIGMPIGTIIVAARAGEVVAIRQDQVDFSPPGSENFVIIQHDDGSVTYVGIYLDGHSRHLHVLEATVPPTMPPPVHFQQSLEVLNADGVQVRYEMTPEGCSYDPAATG